MAEDVIEAASSLGSATEANSGSSQAISSEPIYDGYTFGNEAEGATGLSPDFLSGVESTFPVQPELGSDVDKLATSAEADINADPKSNLEGLVDKWRTDTDNVTDVELDELAAAEKAGTLPTPGSLEGNTDTPDASSAVSTEKPVDNPTEVNPANTISENATFLAQASGYEPTLVQAYLNAKGIDSNAVPDRQMFNDLDQWVQQENNKNSESTPASEDDDDFSDLSGEADKANQAGQATDKDTPEKKPVQSLDDLQVIAQVTETRTPAQEYSQLKTEQDALLQKQKIAEADKKQLSQEDQDKLSQLNTDIADRERFAYINGKEVSGQPLTPAEQADQQRLSEKFVQKPENLKAADDRIKEEAGLKSHYDRLVENGTMSREDADRNIKEGMDKFDEANPEAKKAFEKTTEGKVQKLDAENEQIQQELLDNKITPEQAGTLLQANREARRKIVSELVNTKEKNERKLSGYEEEVAKKGMEMRKLMAEILHAPKIKKSMEQALQKMKQAFDEAKKFKVTETNAMSDEAIKNVDLRDKLSNSIAAQSTHMAKYANIVAVNVNDFISVNSDLEELIGARSGVYNTVVQIGTRVVRWHKGINVNAEAKNIARTGKMPGKR